MRISIYGDILREREREQLPMRFCSIFQVKDAMAIEGIIDYDLANYWDLYTISPEPCQLTPSHPLVSSFEANQRCCT